ncbi:MULTISPECIES: hypothetical protein [Globicatella]|uniref:Uncharacterized protein n=1 Tax=Globicatella sulfidifaciens TaxID=136093 RepID=A0A7X8C1S8_9LACT|nr:MULTISPECIES: hypothetical protein [Globicatella]MDK7630755.1 hypothetical protein [Globicatella sanguinis]NLJ17401.1 hypothetical protein [Globicatella sulfidifaciens]WIK66796.1 hypothetical protein CYJ72_001415 [Globicatella sanguinis]WKT56201.1 hypothetical protein Q3C38_01415 [Globicatella sanguinis]HJF16127.1 hypothetical protein [Globicatella sulfidifaciens]
MIDRSYLPFRSARMYHDRKMAKWMGFFLSEHNSALNDNGDVIDFSKALSLDEKLLLLSQAYVHQLTINFVVGTETITGTITVLNTEQIGVQTKQHYHFIPIKDIITMQLADEIES